MTELTPVRQVLQRRAHGTDVPQHEQQEEEATTHARHAIELLDAGEQAHLGRIRVGTDQIVHDMIAQQEGVDALGHGAQQTIADETADGETHEEMLEGHQLFEIERHGDKEDGIAKRTEERRHNEHLEVESGIHDEVHRHLVAQQQGEAYRQQTGIGQPRHLHPPQTEQTAGDIANDGDEVERCGCHHAPVRYAARECILQYLRSGIHHLSHGKHTEYRP